MKPLLLLLSLSFVSAIRCDIPRFEPDEPTGTWVGERNFRLSHDFVFIDDKGKKWRAPLWVEGGFEANGASIPKVFWSFFGSPWVGEYRNASIIHDYYCDEEIGLSSEVHLMFYEACKASGLNDKKAYIAYYAVRVGGPYWGEEEYLNRAGARWRLLFGNGKKALKKYPMIASVADSGAGLELSLEELEAVSNWYDEKQPVKKDLDRLLHNRLRYYDAVSKKLKRTESSESQ